MSRSMTALVLLLSLLLGAVRLATAQSPKPSINKAEWISFLTRVDQVDAPTSRKLYDFSQIDPEEVYTILKESWKEIPSEALRIDLLQRFGRDSSNGISDSGLPNADPTALYQNEKVRPHLLDVMDLGAEDPAPQVQQIAFMLASEIAIKSIRNAAAYHTWRKEMEGIPLTEVVRANCRALFTQFIQADNTHRADLLDRLSELSFDGGRFYTTIKNRAVTGFIATGLTGVHRNTAIATGLPDGLVQCLKEGTPPEITQRALQILLHLNLDGDFYARHDSDMRRVLTASVFKKDLGNQWFIISSLAWIKPAWATDLLLKLTVDDYPDENYLTAMSALANRKDPRIIPTLLALLDMGVDENQVWTIYHGLAQFDPAANAKGVDADRWLEWWEKNKTNFPPEVRDLPFPRFKEMVNGISIPRRIRRMQLDDDPQRVYWLISPGILISGVPGVTVNASTDGAATVPVKDRPGLMVVLCDGDMSDLKQRTFWMDVAAKAFGSKYLIALVVPPKWNATQKAVWITSNNRSQVKEATFTTETLVADVVKEIVKRYPINPEHVFLHGEGEAGLAAYACSLQPETPFHGFYLLASTFHSSELPPLKDARGRRYFLQYSQSDKTVPYFLASSAGQLLTRAGATVKLDTYQGEHGYKFTGDAWAAMTEALQWLEESK